MTGRTEGAPKVARFRAARHAAHGTARVPPCARLIGAGGPKGGPRAGQSRSTQTPESTKPRKCEGLGYAGGGTRTPDTRIMIPLL